VTEKRPSQKAWSSLISSFLINNTRTFTYDQLVSYLRSTPESIETKHSILIVDTDLTVIQGFGLQPTSSEAVINKIRSLFPSMANVPTLCINDFRARSASKAEKPPNILGQQANISHLEDNHIITLQEKSNDSFDCTSNPIYYLCKPFKNSKLLSALHQLLNPQKKSSVTSTEPLSASSQSQTLSFSSTRSPDSDNRTRSLSSTPDRPLGDILSGINSLLVDDNPINQKVLSRMLSRMGLKPQLAQNGREACDMVIAAKENGTPIDLIFMDIWMPEMNGLEASTKIRQDIASSAVNPYIIAMTACVMPGDREKCINAGMNGYVSKPVRKEELEAALHTYTQTIMINEQQDTDGDGPHSQSSTEEHSCPSTLDMEFTNDHDLPTVSVTLYDDK
jgi:CheY-like chemotaxis protein